MRIAVLNVNFPAHVALCRMEFIYVVANPVFHNFRGPSQEISFILISELVEIFYYGYQGFLDDIHRLELRAKLPSHSEPDNSMNALSINSAQLFQSRSVTISGQIHQILCLNDATVIQLGITLYQNGGCCGVRSI
jgi:hypothetical protein